MDPETDTDSPLDLRSLETVSEFSGHLMCAICHCPFIHPVRLRCDHVFCQSCLQGYSMANSTSIASPFAAWSPPPEELLCPSCRTPTTPSFQSVPRLILSMCDEILVKCPYSEDGCPETIQRGHAQSHVDKYCDYRLVNCPDPDCDKATPKKDLDPAGACRHVLRRCEACGDDIMDLDYETHTTELCPELEPPCPHCRAPIPLRRLADHRANCLEATRACEGAPYGCKVALQRLDILEHEQNCPLVTLGPYLVAQSSRLASLDSTIRQLRQQNETLEDGIASLRSTFTSHAPVPISDPPIVPTAHSATAVPLDLASSPSHNPTFPPEIDTTSEPRPEQDVPTTPSSSTTTYLLSLYESIREEVNQLSSALNTVDARANMSILNESLRLREDMAHINASLNTVRMQVHMIMNLRSHQGGQRADHPGRGAPSSGGDGLGAAGSSRITGALTGAMGGRRLSDGSREVTKL